MIKLSEKAILRRGEQLPEEAVQGLKINFQGKLICPGDPAYNDARRVWNGMIDKYPALIARCHHAEDVIAAVHFAREHGLVVAVRGGGHNVTGNATCDDGLVIDLSAMRQVQVDPEAGVARVQAGATLGDVDRVTQQYGLATPTGNVSATGIAGLTLNGGLGWLRRKHGMSVDNLLAVELVTADGRFLRASKTEHPNLFWGVRGGGGNFGIVTAFEFSLHKVGPEVLFLTTMYPMRLGQEVFTGWRDWTLTAPEQASTDCLFWSVPASPPFPDTLHDTPVVIVGGMYAGPVDEGLSLFQPLRQLGEPLIDMTGPMPYLAVQSMFDSFFPAGLRHYWKSLYMDEISDEGIAAIAAQAALRPSPRTLIPIRHIGGAISRVGDRDTAIANRRAEYLLSIDSTWDDPTGDELNIAWTRQFWSDMRPFSGGGIYLNFGGFSEEGQEVIQAAYGANHERLTALKTKYDPTNLFHLNHNIKPTA